jgi:ubiquinone/menaquinone biosynthesis C-methylase UbiE
VNLRDAWEEQAANWVRWARAPGHDTYWRFHREAFLSLVPPAGRLTLDIGCGEGRVTRDLRKLAHRVIGIDPAPSMIAAAREADPDGEYVQADAAELALREGEADLVTAFMSLMDMDDLPAVVGELGRVLEPGGRLVAAVVHPMNSAGEFQEDGRFRIDTYYERRHLTGTFERDGLVMTFHARHRILEDYSQALERAGFTFERFREIYDEQAETWSRVPLFLDFVAVRR